MKKKWLKFALASSPFLAFGVFMIYSMINLLDSAFIGGPISELKQLGSQLYILRKDTGQYPDSVLAVLQNYKASPEMLDAIRSGKLVYFKPLSSDPPIESILLRLDVDQSRTLWYTYGGNVLYKKN